MIQRIVVIDNEIGFSKNVVALLKNEGYVAQSYSDPIDGLAQVRRDPPALLLLDIRMRVMDGYAVLKELKFDVKTRNIPVVMMSTKSEAADVAVGLEMGAIDYIRKPFEAPELIARVRAALRRGSEAPAVERLVVGPLVVDHTKREVLIGKKKLDLTLIEFEMVSHLAKNEGKIITRSGLFQAVWGTEYIPTSRTLDFHVSRLRRKLGPNREWLKLLRGVGFQFCVDPR